jgi:hypothetical protein
MNVQKKYRAYKTLLREKRTHLERDVAQMIEAAVRTPYPALKTRSHFPSIPTDIWGKGFMVP